MIKTMIIIIIYSITGCSSKHSLVETANYKNINANKIFVNHTQQHANLKLAKAIEDELYKSDLKALNLNTLNLKILEYEPGNAFKRWLMPYWGTTILKANYELVYQNEVILTGSAVEKIPAGGGFTIGAWKYVFTDVAKFIVSDIRMKIRR